MSSERTQHGDGAGTDGGPGDEYAQLRRRRRIVLATLLLGVVVMVAFDHWFTLIAGLVLMLGSVVAGVFLIAAPGGFLDRDVRDDDGERLRPPHRG